MASISDVLNEITSDVDGLTSNLIDISVVRNQVVLSEEIRVSVRGGNLLHYRTTIFDTTRKKTLQTIVHPTRSATRQSHKTIVTSLVRQKSAKRSKDKHTCPLCERTMILRASEYGSFWGCTGYPDCEGVINAETGKPNKKTAGLIKQQKVRETKASENNRMSGRLSRMKISRDG